MSLSEKVWNGFKELVECPGREEGVRKKIGICLYVATLLVAIALLLSMFRGSQPAHVSYRSEGGDNAVAVVHRAPDIVVCPRHVINAKTKHNVALNLEMVSVAEISDEDIDKLSRQYRESCEEGKTCSWENLEKMCQGTEFENYCAKLDSHMRQNTLYRKFEKREFETREHNTQPVDKLRLIQVAALAILREENGEKWTLKMLWLAIISEGYDLITAVVKQRADLGDKRNGLLCDYYNVTYTGSLDLDIENNIQQRETSTTLWVGDSLCIVQFGVDLLRRSTPFFGCTAFEIHPDYRPKESKNNFLPFRYWIGNLEETELREGTFFLSSVKAPFSDTKATRIITGIVHYSMIEVRDQTKSKKECKAQPIIRGAALPCPQKQVAIESWHYELTTQDRQINKIWVYGKAKVTLERTAIFTTYTQFQLGAGVLGCLLGMSISQFLDIVMLFYERLVGKKLKLAIRLISLCVMACVTIALTAFDMSSYAGNRYSPIFTEKQSELEIPAIKLCVDKDHPYSFINVTKLDELNVSLQLYGYLKFAGFFRYPRVKLVAKWKSFENGTTVQEVPEWMIRNYHSYHETVNVCHKDLAFCEMVVRDLFIDDYIPRYDGEYLPKPYNREDRERFLRAMREETKVLANKLSLPRNFSLQEITNHIHLDPKQLFTECRARNKSVSDCGKYAEYTYDGAATLCLSLAIPESAATTKRDFGYENGLFVTFDNDQYHKHSDINAYYGPGLRKEAASRVMDTKCGPSVNDISPESAAEGYVPTKYCLLGSGWSLNIQLQSYDTAEIEYRIHRFLPPTSFVAEIQTAFTQRDLDTDCKEKNETPMCIYPNVEVAAVFREIHYETQCSCSICYGSNKGHTVEILRIVSNILGRRAHCCRDDEFYSCFSDIATKVEWMKMAEAYRRLLAENKVAAEHKKPWELGARYHKFLRKNFTEDTNYLEFQRFLYPVPAMAKDRLRNSKAAHLRKYFAPYISRELSASQMERFAEYTRRCYEKSCKIESLELMNLQPEKSYNNKSVFTIFYSTPNAYGMEVIDTFDPVQLVATLMSGYSITFGISMIGVIEIIFLIATNWKTQRASSVVDKERGRHIIKSFPLFFSSQPKVNKISATRNERNRNEETDEGEAVEKHEGSLHIPCNSSCPDSREKIRSVAPSGSMRDIRERVDEVRPKDQRCENEIEDIEMEDFVEAGIAKAPVGESKMEAGIPEEEPRGSWIPSVLVMLLLALSLSALGFVAYFFLTFTNDIYDGEVAMTGHYEHPSAIICVKEKGMVKNLMSGLKEASCISEDWSGKCDQLFTAFIRLRESLFCVLQDNTRKFAEMDRTKDDLVMEVTDRFPEAAVGAISLNETSLDKIYPFTYFKAGENALISYSASLRLSEKSDCLKSIPVQVCKTCPREPSGIQPLTICCFPPKKHEPAMTPRRTCHQYRYRVQITTQSKEPGAKGRTLRVKATKRSMMVYAKRNKYNFVYYLSIVGGFFGAFIEVTVLNIVGALTLMLFRLLRG